jgi:hypothetical protein
MKEIHITRISKTEVKFQTVCIDQTETVFFINDDPDAPHKPSILKLPGNEQLGPSPSPPSSQVPVPVPSVPFMVQYTCEIAGHNEKGTIQVFAVLDADKTALTAITGKPTRQRVVVGGMPVYKIINLMVNNTNVPGSSTGPPQVLPIGPGLTLSQDSNGIWVGGTPTQAGTFNFTFTVDDSMGRNLQQVPYSLVVS